MNRVLVVDGSNLIWRTWFALPKFTTSYGRPTGATFGFIRTVQSQMKKFRADMGVIAFDVRGSSDFRKKLDPNYKVDRVYEDTPSFFDQWEDTKEICKLAGFTVLEDKGYEADDIICTIAEQLSFWDHIEAIRILSVDHDLLQCLVHDKIELLRQVPQKGDDVWSRRRVIREIGLEPERLPELWALIGDPGDCVPSIMSQMQALEYLKTSTVNDDPQLTETGQKIARNYTLVKSRNWTDSWGIKEVDWEGARCEFERLEMRSFIKNLDESKQVRGVSTW